MNCSLVSQMNKRTDPYKCILSLTATGRVGCSLHAVRAISFISVLTCFPSGRWMSVLCQSLFSSWSVCGTAARLGVRLGREELGAHQALAHQTVVSPKTTGCSLCHWQGCDSLVQAQPKCLSWFLLWASSGIFSFIFFFYISLCTEMPSKKMVCKLLQTT